MASDKEIVDFVFDQIENAGEITAKKMEDKIEDRDCLSELIRISLKELPEPKPKKKKKSK